MFGIERDPEVIAGVEDVDLTGTSVLVTGSTKGLGRAAALALGRLGADVVVHGRDREAGERTVAALEAVGTDGTFVPADFERPAEVSALADAVVAEVGELDVLCNNAGGLFRDDGPTDLGVERTFHVNHLSPYQLTAELLAADALAPEGRVVTTSSMGHRLATLDLDTLAPVPGLSPWAAYWRSKLANVLFANELARRLAAVGSAVTSNSLHPGLVPGSEFARGLPAPAPLVGQLLGELPWTDSVADGAATIVYLAASPDVEGVSGKYFARCRERRPTREATDFDAQQTLWERSAELLGIAEPLADAVD